MKYIRGAQAMKRVCGILEVWLISSQGERQLECCIFVLKRDRSNRDSTT